MFHRVEGRGPHRTREATFVGVACSGFTHFLVGHRRMAAVHTETPQLKRFLLLPAAQEKVPWPRSFGHGCFGHYCFGHGCSGTVKVLGLRDADYTL